MARRRKAPPWEHKPSPTDAEEASGLRALVRVWCLLIWPNALIPDTHADNHECIVILTQCLSRIQIAQMHHSLHSLLPFCVWKLNIVAEAPSGHTQNPKRFRLVHTRTFHKCSWWKCWHITLLLIFHSSMPRQVVSLSPCILCSWRQQDGTKSPEGHHTRLTRNHSGDFWANSFWNVLLEQQVQLVWALVEMSRLQRGKSRLRTNGSWKSNCPRDSLSGLVNTATRNVWRDSHCKRAAQRLSKYFWLVLRL